MPNDYLDIKSPYLRHNIYSSRETPRRNFIAINHNRETQRETSDTLLQEKVTTISKRIVGEEIRKFSEVASREISEEFTELESRIQTNNIRYTKQYLTETLRQMRSDIQKDVYTKVDSLQANLEQALDLKLQALNELALEVDAKLEDLYNLSVDLDSSLESETEVGQNYLTEDPIFKINKPLNTSESRIPKNVSKSITILNDTVSDTQPVPFEARRELHNELITREKEIGEIYPEVNNSNPSVRSLKLDPETYFAQELKKVSSSFDQKGFLFKKNVYESLLKGMLVQKFLNKSIDLSLNDGEREKMSFILEKKMAKSGLEPEEKETIENFLKRCFLKECES